MAHRGSPLAHGPGRLPGVGALALLALALPSAAQSITGEGAFASELEDHLLTVASVQERAEFVEAYRESMPSEAPTAADILGQTYISGVKVRGEQELQREALVELLGKCSTRELLELVRPLVVDEDPYLRCAGLRLAAAHVPAARLDLFLAALSPLEDGSHPGHRVRKTFELEVTAWLRSDPNAIQLLILRRVELDEDSTVSLLRAVAGSGRGAGLPLLTHALIFGQVPAYTALGELSRLASSLGEADADGLLDVLLDYLDPEDPPTCQAAVQALGRLGLPPAVEPLIPLLDSESRGVREGAHWALCEITGMTLRPAAQRWRIWHDAELAWYADAGPGVEHMLTSDDAAEVAAALLSVSEHPLFANEFWRALEVALWHSEPSIREFALQMAHRLRPGIVGPDEDPGSDDAAPD